jgi:hypothetical protein
MTEDAGAPMAGGFTPASKRIEQMSGGAIDQMLERAVAMRPPRTPALPAQHRGEIPGDTIETIQTIVCQVFA